MKTAMEIFTITPSLESQLWRVVAIRIASPLLLSLPYYHVCIFNIIITLIFPCRIRPANLNKVSIFHYISESGIYTCIGITHKKMTFHEKKVIKMLKEVKEAKEG